MNQNFILNVFNLIKEGYNPSQISLKLNISKQSLNYYLSSLKKQGLIKKVGYGVWEIDKIQEVKTLNKDAPLNLKQVKNIRGHAFIWKVRIKEKYDWRKLLESKQINYEDIGIKGTPRIILNGVKIWLGKKNIVIYEKDSYFAKNAIESKKLAIYSLIDKLKSLSQYLSIPPFRDFKFTCSREHFSLIQNCLAIQCDKERKSILVRNEQGYWMSIDNSLNLHEAEAISKDSMLDIEGIKKYFNSHKETQFKVTPSFLLENINKVTQNQLMFAENIQTHMKVLKDIGAAINKLNKTIKNKSTNKNQKTLGDFI